MGPAPSFIFPVFGAFPLDPHAPPRPPPPLRSTASPPPPRASPRAGHPSPRHPRATSRPCPSAALGLGAGPRGGEPEDGDGEDVPGPAPPPSLRVPTPRRLAALGPPLPRPSARARPPASPRRALPAWQLAPRAWGRGGERGLLGGLEGSGGGGRREGGCPPRPSSSPPPQPARPSSRRLPPPSSLPPQDIPARPGRRGHLPRRSCRCGGAAGCRAAVPGEPAPGEPCVPAPARSGPSPAHSPPPPDRRSPQPGASRPAAEVGSPLASHRGDGDRAGVRLAVRGPQGERVASPCRVRASPRAIVSPRRGPCARSLARWLARSLSLRLPDSVLWSLCLSPPSALRPSVLRPGRAGAGPGAGPGAGANFGGEVGRPQGGRAAGWEPPSPQAWARSCLGLLGSLPFSRLRRGCF